MAPDTPLIDAEYFRAYRKRLGFSNQQDAKAFFSAKDIPPCVDFGYIDLLNARLIDIVGKLDGLVQPGLRQPDLAEFCDHNINQVYSVLRQNDILVRLNNQGRRPEQVYYSWMRGYITSAFFLGSLGAIFGVEIGDIALIGGDDLVNIETFKRTPTADLELRIAPQTVVRLEIQSGFQGINDIKQHKVLEAKRIYREQAIISIAIHFDLFNGQVAFVRLDDIEDDSINWITRQQMEGQTVFNVEQNYFAWKLTEDPPHYEDFYFSLR